MSSSSGFYGAVRLTHRLVLVYGFISNHAGLLKVPLRLLYEQPGLLFNPPSTGLRYQAYYSYHQD